MSIARREALLNDDEVDILRADVSLFLKDHGHPCNTVVSAGQPLALELWDALAHFLGDVDAGLPSILQRGVPTGVLATIPCFGVWQPTDCAERPALDLQVHGEPWHSATADPDCLMKLVSANVAAGFASGCLAA